MASDMTVEPCTDLDAAVERHVGRGYRLDAIGPADDPSWAELSRSDDRIRLDASTGGPTAGVEPVDRMDGFGHEISHESSGSWQVGRAGMRYRDLVPGRLGGAIIASHIHVPDGGPVPDYVHHHDIDFQMIFCHRGWVRVVYEDQGPPFVMEPGDCVLQPPGIRHRVLESSDDLFVVEIASPADHRTLIDHELTLPTDRLRPERRFGGQRFVRSVAADGAEVGIEAATGGLAAVRRARAAVDDGVRSLGHDHDVRLVFVLSGQIELIAPDGRLERLAEGSSASIPPGEAFQFHAVSAAQLLDVGLRLS